MLSLASKVRRLLPRNAVAPAPADAASAVSAEPTNEALWSAIEAALHGSQAQIDRTAEAQAAAHDEVEAAADALQSLLDEVLAGAGRDRESNAVITARKIAAQGGGDRTRRRARDRAA